MSTGMDFDIIFSHALKLLHSKSKDSTAQLKQLYDDLVTNKSAVVSSLTAAKNANGATKSNSAPGKKTLDAGGKVPVRSISVSSGKSGLTPADVDAKKAVKTECGLEEPQERTLSVIKTAEKRTPSYGEPSTEPELKKPKMEFDSAFSSPSRTSSGGSTYSPSKSVHSSPLQGATISIPAGSVSGGSSRPSSDTEDMDTSNNFAVDMGITCVVCQTFDVTAKNNLIECQGCKALYHQECHKPWITEREANDPRNVWYCAKCAKPRVAATANTQKSTTASTSKVQLKLSSTPSSLKPIKDQQSVAATVAKTATASLKPDQPQLFKRDTKQAITPPPLGGNGGGGNGSKPTGLLGLAASLTLSSKAADGSKGVTKPPLKTIGGAKSNLPMKTSLLTTTAVASATKTPSVAGQPKPGSSNTTSVITSATASAASSTSCSNPAGNGNGGGVIRSGSMTSLPPQLAADKRLQSMKKKAAAKLKDKRMSTK